MNLVTRNLARLLAAVSAGYSLSAFARHVSIYNIDFWLTSIAASINFGAVLSSSRLSSGPELHCDAGPKSRSRQQRIYYLNGCLVEA